MALICGVDRCLMIFASRGAMWKHYDVMHKGVPIPTIWHIVSAQHLDNRSHKTYFWVTEPSYVFRPILNKDWINILDTWIDNAMKTILLFNSDPHYLNALLTKTKWADHVKGLDPDELCSLVRLPRANEFPLLKETMEWIIEVAMICIEGTPEIILQQLNTKELALWVYCYALMCHWPVLQWYIPWAISLPPNLGCTKELWPSINTLCCFLVMTWQNS